MLGRGGARDGGGGDGVDRPRGGRRRRHDGGGLVAERVLEAVDEVLGARRARVGILRQPVAQDRVDGAREVGADVARDRDLGLDVGARLRGRVVDVERAATR